jgi:hypothetical protein
MFVEDMAIFLKAKDDIHMEALTKNIDINERVKTIVQWCIKNKKTSWGFYPNVCRRSLFLHTTHL